MDVILSLRPSEAEPEKFDKLILRSSNCSQLLSLRRIRTLRVATRDHSFLRMTARSYRTRNFRNSLPKCCVTPPYVHLLAPPAAAPLPGGPRLVAGGAGIGAGLERRRRFGRAPEGRRRDSGTAPPFRVTTR